MRVIKNTGKWLMARKGHTGRLASWVLACYEGYRGPVYATENNKQAIAAGRSIQRGLAEIRKRWPEVRSTAQEEPVFIFSAGWRSGSTLMQRLVMSGRTIMIWGEPYSHARIFRHLAAGVSAITQDWPSDNWFVDKYDPAQISKTFIANMYPQVQDLLHASLSYTRTLISEPALDRGFQRWGMKDVRMTIDDAYFLRWLFPKAKFIFLCRNPYEAYRSYRIDRSWYNEWPNDPVFTAEQFGRHWRSLVEGFQSDYRDVGGIFVRYEDLCSGSYDVVDIANYLKLDIDPGVLKSRVGGHRHNAEPLPGCELRLLRKEVAVLAQSLGYDG